MLFFPKSQPFKVFTTSRVCVRVHTGEYSLRLRKIDVFYFDQSCLTARLLQIFCTNSKIDKLLLKYL
jgi:hypothetical protein